MDDFLLPLNESGQPPESRIKDASAAHAIYEAMRSADFPAAQDRAIVQDVLDGAPPIPPSALSALGQSYRANLNWGEGLADHESALASYNDLVTGVDRLYNCFTSMGDSNQQTEWNDIISDFYHELLIDWEDFHFNHLLNAHYFVSQGLSVVTWPDNRNWQYSVTPIGDFFIPRDSWACDSKVDVAVARRNYPVWQLYQCLESAKKEEGTGWNKQLLQKVLMKNLGISNETDVEEMQRAFKNNDYYQTYARKGQVRTLTYFVREYNGTYSRYIGLRDGSEKEFLYQNIGEFGAANQAFVVFPYGVGTNGCFHSIRGLSQKNFAFNQSSNRLRNAALDGSLIRATLLVEGSNSNDREALTLAYAGPLSQLPAGVKASPVQMPNLANEIMPIIRDMAILRHQNNGGYLSHTLSPEGGDRTATEVQAQIAQSNVLSSASLDLFYEPWRKVGKEIFRRLKRENWDAAEPGAQAALEFRKRVTKAGVPWEAVQAVYKVQPVRAVGYGSPAARIAAYNRLLQIAPQFDPVGQGNLVRDIVTQTIGPGMADRYKAKGQQRMGVGAKIAELENDSMQSGRGVNVLEDEDHFVHGLIHAQDGEAFADASYQNKIDPVKALQYLVLQVPHLGTHLGYLKPNDMRAPQIQAMRKILGKMNEVLQGLAKQAAAGNFNNQDPSAAPAEGQPGQPDPETQMIMQKNQVEIDLMKARSAAEIQILQAKAKQEMDLKDAKAAQEGSANLRKAPSQTEPRQPTPVPY